MAINYEYIFSLANHRVHYFNFSTCPSLKLFALRFNLAGAKINETRLYETSVCELGENVDFVKHALSTTLYASFNAMNGLIRPI